jgi:hypothetical protein
MPDPSFPSKVFTLARQLNQETSQETRERLTLEIAEEASQTYDPTDANLVDEYHLYFEEFLEARALYRQMGYRLGRFVSQTADVIRDVEEKVHN